MAAIQFPTGFNMGDYVGHGITAAVYLDSSSNTVVKCPHEDREPIEVERRIYERFRQYGGHPGLLSYHGTFESGIRLEYASKNGIRYYMQTHKVDTKQRLEWAQQISSALAHVHSMHVIHADVTCANIALDDRLRAKLLDFAGSSLDGSEPLVAVTASHQYPGDLKTIRADLFALGSTLYEIFTGKPPYHELERIEIMEMFKQSQFPDTKLLGPIGEIITGCWRGKFTSANDILNGTQLLDSHYPFMY